MTDIQRALDHFKIQEQRERFNTLCSALQKKYRKLEYYGLPVTVRYPHRTYVMPEVMFDVVHVLIVNPRMTAKEISISLGVAQDLIVEIMTKLKKANLVKGEKDLKLPKSGGRVGYIYEALPYTSKKRMLVVSIRGSKQKIVRRDTYYVRFDHNVEGLFSPCAYKLICFLRDRTDVCTADLMKGLGKTRRDIYAYTKRLHELELLEITKDGRNLRFNLLHSFAYVPDVEVLTLGHN